MDHFDKWLEWVWVPFIAGAMVFGRWVLVRFEQIRSDRDTASAAIRADIAKEILKLDERIAKAEERQLQVSVATETYIDVLHKKINAVRDELKDSKADAERRFASKDDLHKADDRLTASISELRQWS